MTDAFSPAPAKKRKRLLLLVVGPIILLTVGLYFFLSGDRYVSTDNAYVKSDKTSIAPQVTGRVVKVNIRDNARVTAGQVLFEIDREPFAIAVAQAEANLGTVRADIESIRADYLQKQAELAQSDETIRYQQHEFARYATLAGSHAVAAAKLDQVRHDRDQAVSERAALAQELAAEAARLGGDFNLPVEEHPHYKQAMAALDKAKLDLSYVGVAAPTDGVAANVTLQPGEFVAAGLPLFSVVRDQYVWIEANFKETDLTHVRAGQPVEMDVDAYPHHHWDATVASITPATGAEFSILPAQNSSGNWVKVVQRLMVRIELKNPDPQYPLAAGMSTNVTIDTGRSRLGRWMGHD